MKQLNISDTVQLPLDAVTQKLAFLGTTGAGKSHAAGKVAEEMHAGGAQIVALDPVGIWYGLRSAADGKLPGIPIPVFGGLHGDVPLEPTGGALIADLIVDKHLSCVLDVSQFEHDSHKAKFAGDFALRLFFRKKSSPSAMHLFLEECEEFLPQEPERGEERMIHEFKRIWKLGRNFGIGGSLISQRPQEVLKKALNLSECLFAFRTTGTHERKAIRDWISEKGLNQDIAADLPKLATGQCHLWSPSWLKVSETIKITRKWTFDAGSTPKVGDAKAGDRRRIMAEINLAEIASQMAATIEQAKANDPTLLKVEVAKLRKELTAKMAAPPAIVPEIKEVSVLTDEDKKLLARGIEACETILANFDKLQSKIAESIVDMRNFFEPIRAKISALPQRAGNMQRVCLPLKPAPVIRRPVPQRDAGPVRALRGEGSGEFLPIGEARVLTACIQFPDGVTRQQLTVLTTFKRSTRDAYIARLREKGLVEVSGEMVLTTAEGIARLPGAQPLPTGLELQQHWLGILPEGECRILQILMDQFPNAVSRDDISERTGFKRSTRDAYLSRMSAKMLFTEPARGMVRASENLFEL